MLKWCNVGRKNQSEVLPVVVQCKKSQFEEHSYQALDSSLREEINVVAILAFPQQKIEETSLGRNRQICYLDNPQFISAIPDIKHENNQYQAWIKNIKSVLQNMQKSELKKISDYKNAWEACIESILKDLSIKNKGLLKECKRKIKEMQYLEDLLEKIQEENVEMIDAINQSTSEESIKRNSFSSSTETIVSEEPSSTYVRSTSKESGYSSQGSTETLVLEEPESIFMQTNAQIIELEKKNELYKEWISSLGKNLKSNLTLNFIKLSKTPDLKMLEDLKASSFKNAELKQENKEAEEIIQSLEIELEKLEQENAGIHVLYRHILSGEIYLHTLDSLEKRLDNEQKEIEDIDSYFEKLQEKAAELYINIETFTICLEKNKKLNYLLKN